MVKRMSAREARARLSEILGMVHFGKETVIIEKQGKPIVAVIDIDLYERWRDEREARFRALDEIRARKLDKTPQEVEGDVAAAVSEVRAGTRLPRGRRAQSGR